MTIPLSQAVSRIQPSVTLSLNAKVTALQSQGKKIINLTVGEPDLDTPDFIKEAACLAMRQGKTKYTPVDGTPSLKEAIVEKAAATYHLNYNRNQVHVSCGAKQAMFNLCTALINPGDEVIIPAPYWVSYPEIIQLLGGIPVIISTNHKQHYKIIPEQLEKAITSKTKLFIINSPSNPSGMAYSPQELTGLSEILRRHPQIFIATDDIYESIIWNPLPFTNILMACPTLYDRTIIIHGVSKAYAMTGWRIGYALGHPALIRAMATVQSQTTSNPCSISQAAAEAAIRSDQQTVRQMVKIFKERYDTVFASLNQIDGISLTPSDGTFYVFPDISSILNRSEQVHNDIELCEYLLDQAGLAVVPGSAFGSPDNFRLSFSIELNLLKEAMRRLKIAIEKI